MIYPSRRAALIKPQPMFDILSKAKGIERLGQKVIHLEIGDTQAFSNTVLRGQLEDCLKQSTFGYSPSAGEEDLRSAIAALYTEEKGVLFQSKHVVVSPANALIAQTLAVVCDEGDEVLIPDPGFPTYSLAAAFNKIKPVYYTLQQNRAWNPCLDEVESLLGPNVRAIIINSPSNPLGVVLDAGVLSSIVDMAEKRGIVCILDETYQHLIYSADATDKVNHRDNCLYIFSLSKEAAAPGLRVGGLVGADTIIQKVSDYNSMFFSCQPDFIQKAAALTIREGNHFREIIQREMPKRIAAVNEILSQSHWLSYKLPDAAFYFYVNIGETKLKADEFAEILLNRHRVAVCPGTCFGPAGEDYIRISIAGPANDLTEGCSALVGFVDELYRTTVAC